MQAEEMIAEARKKDKRHATHKELTKLGDGWTLLESEYASMKHQHSMA